jgi:hypothetical protein
MPAKDFYHNTVYQVYTDLFSEAIGQLIINKNHLNLVVFDIQNKEIVKWIT